MGPGSVWVSYANATSGAVQAAGARVSGRGRVGRFSPPQSIPTRHGQGDASGLAVGPRGQVLVTYENIASPRRSRIYTALDPDGLGPRGFGRPRLLARTRVKFPDFIPAQPDRGIDAEPKLAWDTGPGPYHGRVYAVWTQAARRNRDNLNVMFQHSDNSGRTWTKAVPLNDAQTVNSQFFQSIALDQATGDIAVGWYDCRNAHGQGGHGCARPDTYTQFWATYSTDGGTQVRPGLPGQPGHLQRQRHAQHLRLRRLHPGRLPVPPVLPRLVRQLRQHRHQPGRQTAPGRPLHRPRAYPGQARLPGPR